MRAWVENVVFLSSVIFCEVGRLRRLISMGFTGKGEARTSPIGNFEGKGIYPNPTPGGLKAGGRRKAY